MASSKRALLAKAATSKAAAWGARTTSKAAAIAQTLDAWDGSGSVALALPEAGMVGATARRFQKGFSKAGGSWDPGISEAIRIQRISLRLDL